MAVTKRHCVMLFLRGYTIESLCKIYDVERDWIEEGLRRYWMRAASK